MLKKKTSSSTYSVFALGKKETTNVSCIYAKLLYFWTHSGHVTVHRTFHAGVHMNLSNISLKMILGWRAASLKFISLLKDVVNSAVHDRGAACPGWILSLLQSPQCCLYSASHERKREQKKKKSILQHFIKSPPSTLCTARLSAPSDCSSSEDQDNHSSWRWSVKAACSIFFFQQFFPPPLFHQWALLPTN